MPNPPDSLSAIATRLTLDEHGHTLNRRQVLSPDGSWVVFDTRNDDTQIGTTPSIQRVHVSTGRVEPVYQVEHATQFGPGVGAAAYHPHEEKILFIHGLMNCCQESPYGIARRFGALWDHGMGPAEFRLGVSRVDGHVVTPSVVPLGILSGGTHAHSWSPNGQRVSFTYDDALRPTMPRTVGFMTSDPKVVQLVAESFHKVRSSRSDPAETFEGRFASFLLFEPDPNLGIRKAVEECWVSDRTLAFLGSIVSKRGEEMVEIFVADLPSDPEIAGCLRDNSRENLGQMLPGIEFRRLTFLENRPFSGVQGPRHWLVASPDGQTVYFLLRDLMGIVQLAEVGIDTGDWKILTALDHDIEGQISIDPLGNRIALVSGGLVHVHNLATGETVAWQETSWRRTPESEPIGESLPYDGSYVGAVHFVGERQLLVNRYIRGGTGKHLQILRLEI
ncbi:MAG: DUF3748 domain-containing protein [Pirellula sp.]|nr:DUF3748 domain-containing protein [Pirellula sp.]